MGGGGGLFILCWEGKDIRDLKIIYDLSISFISESSVGLYVP